MSGPRALGSNFCCLKGLSGYVKRDQLTSGVGDGTPPRCYNYAADVKSVQSKLKQFHPAEGGPPIGLVVDGVVGPMTKQAIRNFQQHWRIFPAGQERPDGIVDPKGKTFERLLAGPGRLIDLPAEFVGRIPRVIEITTAARAVLALAKDFLRRGNNGSAIGQIGKAELDKVDKHFKVRFIQNPVQRIESIDRIFFTMQTALAHALEGRVIAVEEPPSLARGTLKETFFLAFLGGFHVNDKNDKWEGIHRGSIYICPDARRLGPESFAYGMVHELAHYCGPDSEWGIDDHAYFMRDPVGYKNLSPQARYTNADCYAQFAFEAIGKPDFSAVQ